MQKVTPPAWWRGPLVLAGIGVSNVPNVSICVAGPGHGDYDI